MPNKRIVIIGLTEYLTNTIHVWYIHLHLVDFYVTNVGKYTSSMDPMGKGFQGFHLNDVLFASSSSMIRSK